VIVAPLTGLENDGSDLTETVGLDTHIQDVVSLVRREQLSGITLRRPQLCGMIITGVAEHVREQIADLVYVDALIPEHGQSAMDILPESTRQAFLQLAEDGGGWRMRPPRPFSTVGSGGRCGSDLCP
jgi:hypothetical protein